MIAHNSVVFCPNSVRNIHFSDCVPHTVFYFDMLLCDAFETLICISFGNSEKIVYFPILANKWHKEGRKEGKEEERRPFINF